MQKNLMPAPHRAGTRGSRYSIDRLLRAAGDDPDTIVALIRVMDLMIARQRPRRKKKKSTTKH